MFDCFARLDLERRPLLEAEAVKDERLARLNALLEDQQRAFNAAQREVRAPVAHQERALPRECEREWRRASLAALDQRYALGGGGAHLDERRILRHGDLHERVRGSPSRRGAHPRLVDRDHRSRGERGREGKEGDPSAHAGILSHPLRE